MHSTGTYEALQQVRSLRAQLKVAHRRTRNCAIQKTAAADLEAKAAAHRRHRSRLRHALLSTPEGRSLARLNSGLGTLLSALDTADAAPTTQQLAMFGELEKALQEQLSAWAQLKIERHSATE